MGDKRRPRVGDVLEVETENGLGYVQYTHKTQEGGELIRVLPGLYTARPDMGSLSQEKELYHVYFLVSSAVRHGMVKVVGNYQVPLGAARPKRMRKPLSRRGLKILNWIIVDENGQRTVDHLTDDEKDLSQDLIWNPAMLATRLAQRWTPREEVRISEAIDEKAAPIPVRPSIDEPASDAAALQLLVQERPHWIRHYFYFPKKGQAENLAARLRQEGFETISRRSGDEKSWLALARHQIVPETEAIEQLRERFEAMAAELSGEYDGWEAEVPDGSALH